MKPTVAARCSASENRSPNTNSCQRHHSRCSCRPIGRPPPSAHADGPARHGTAGGRSEAGRVASARPRRNSVARRRTVKIACAARSSAARSRGRIRNMHYAISDMQHATSETQHAISNMQRATWRQTLTAVSARVCEKAKQQTRVCDALCAAVQTACMPRAAQLHASASVCVWRSTAGRRPSPATQHGAKTGRGHALWRLLLGAYLSAAVTRRDQRSSDARLLQLRYAVLCYAWLRSLNAVSRS